MVNGSLDPSRVISELRELHRLTGNANGAQRLCWTEEWNTARAWLRTKLAELPVEVETDEAGNLWATLRGRPGRALAIGSHLDSITNGGWLDGCLGVVAGLEVVRRFAAQGTPPITVRLVDWADEEGARFSTGCFGSGAATGKLDPDAVRDLVDASGQRLELVLRDNGVDIDRAKLAQRHMRDLAAYLELHIEQGPILESLDLPLGVVLGTFGLEKHLITFRGLAAHAGATPMRARRDSFLAAARFALAARDIALRHGGVTTIGRVNVTPGQPSVIAGETAITLDQRCFDAAALASMLSAAKRACDDVCREEGVSAEWRRTWAIDRLAFDTDLIAMGERAIAEVCGAGHRLPSGALHDAAEVAHFGVPSVMLFVQSLRGLSHNRDEDTREAHLALAVRALDRLSDKVVSWLSR